MALSKPFGIGGFPGDRFRLPSADCPSLQPLNHAEFAGSPRPPVPIDLYQCSPAARSAGGGVSRTQGHGSAGGGRAALTVDPRQCLYPPASAR